jgi:hypothetical protein
MKTAMQIVYEAFDTSHREGFLEWLINNRTELLAKEKEQIVDAYIEGSKLNVLTHDRKTNAEFYYTQTYKQQKEK